MPGLQSLDITYVTVAELTLLVAGTDHRVIHAVVMPTRLIAGFTVDQRQHRLHELVRRTAVGYSARQMATVKLEKIIR